MREGRQHPVGERQVAYTVRSSRMPLHERDLTSRWRRYTISAAIALAYVAACRVMLAPICNFGRLATASYGGDARAFIWVLAWDNHAVLDRVPSLFDANKLYPLPNALAYGEHLFGISLFTMPVYAATRNPVLAYNVVWIFAYLAAAAAAAFALVWPFARHYFILHSESPAFIAAAAADLAGWLVPPENTFAGHWLLDHGVKGPRWIWGELTVYLGWMTLALGCAGAIVALRSADRSFRRARFFIVLCAIAAVLALGPSSREVASGSFGWSPFGVLARVPGLSLFRIPARYTELMNLALAVLAAIAAAAMHRRFGRAGRVASVAAMLLLLAESYVVNFPGGQPQPFAVPAVYKYIATLPPGPVLSLPDYANTPLWFDEADYQYFSTAHWQPTVNGDSREWPPHFLELTARLKTFPEPAAATTMRDIGLKYVVVHGARREAEGLVEPARASGDFQLLARFDQDYLFQVVPAPARSTP